MGKRIQEGIRSSGAGESDSCEIPDKGTGNKILVTLEEQKVL